MPVHVIQAISLIGLTGIYYKSAGAALAWLLVALTAWTQIREAPHGSLSTHRLWTSRLWTNRLFRLAFCLITALALGSLFSVNPLLSLEGCLKIALGMLFFIPGLFLGRQLQRGPLPWWQIAPFSLLYLSHFLFPHSYEGNLIFGFSDNPNTIGQGATYALLLLGIISCAEPPGNRDVPLSKRLLLLITAAILTSLLIISNCRQGWLAIATGATVFVMTDQRISGTRKTLLALASATALGTLVAVRDYKGFGYGSVGERLDLWSRSLQAWIQHFPIFGAGFSSYEAMSKYYYFGNVTRIYWHPHNVIVEILFSGGLWAAIAITAFIIALARHLSRQQPLREADGISRACLGALAGMLVIGQLDMGITSIRFTGSLAALAGLFYAQFRHRQQKPLTSADRPPSIIQSP